MARQYILRIRTDSDWHIGSGFGRPGDVDRMVLRDAAELPYIPAKTITGLWRDAGEIFAKAMDHGSPEGYWHRWLRFLFGDQPAREAAQSGQRNDHFELPMMRLGEPPHPAALSIRPAQIPADIRSLLSGKRPSARLLRASLVFVKPAIAIDPASGRAKDQCLRFEEQVRCGLTLSAPVSINARLDEEQTSVVDAFLALTALLVERMGAKRRRGSGKCRWSVEAVHDPLDPGTARELNAEQFLTLLQSEGLSAAAPAAAAAQQPSTMRQNGTSLHAENTGALAPAASGATFPQWYDIPLALRLDSPLSAPLRIVGNVVETLDFVPGTYLLARVCRFLDEVGIGGEASVAANKLRVLPLTIEVGGQASLPVPNALFSQKDEETLASSNATRNRLVQVEVPGEPQFKQVRAGYIALDALQREIAGFQRVPLETRTHNTIAEQSQRPTEAVGGVYSYEAISPGTFHGTLRIRKELWEVISRNPGWRAKLAGRIRLGRSRKDDYGNVSLQAGEGRLVTASVADVEPRETIDVLLVSDAILQDSSLRLTPTVQQLGAELERAIRRESGQVVALVPEISYTRARRIDSWQVGWHLPRPTLVTMQAGSCVRFRLDAHSAVPSKALQSIEAAGIGLRRAEGFGHVRFNLPLLAQPAVVRVNHQTSDASEFDPALVRPDAPTHETGRAIELGCWRKLIAEAALANAEQLARTLGWGTKPSSTQLGVLRAELRRLASWDDRPAFGEWLDHVEQTRSRAEKWPPASFRGIRQLLDIGTQGATASNAAIWRELAVDEWPTVTADGRDSLRAQLWGEAVRAVFDAAIRHQQRAAQDI